MSYTLSQTFLKKHILGAEGIKPFACLFLISSLSTENICQAVFNQLPSLVLCRLQAQLSTDYSHIFLVFGLYSWDSMINPRFSWNIFHLDNYQADLLTWTKTLNKLLVSIHICVDHSLGLETYLNHTWSILDAYLQPNWSLLESWKRGNPLTDCQGHYLLLLLQF